ncbi:MAG TPA: XdhC family protein, partial [Sunxiuqinia sp.]|nr:XdhC family protein [Sunxiuqinia sp.]
MKSIFSDIINQFKNGRNLVLGTLIKTKGSTPQVPGASAIFNAEGLVTGTLGGGLIEAEATKLAKQIAGTSQTICKEISLNGKITDQSGAICGGSATILLDAQPEVSLLVFRQITKSLQMREAGILLTEIQFTDSQQISVNRFWLTETTNKLPECCIKHQLTKDRLTQIADGKKAKIIEAAEQQTSYILFAEPVHPQPELLIVG